MVLILCVTKFLLMSLNFPIIIADESVDVRIIKSLIEEGYSIYSIIAESPGITDLNVIRVAFEKNGFIVTEDKDFGDELVYKKAHNIGSLLLRISDLPIAERLELVRNTFAKHGDQMRWSFSVLTSKKLRIRPYPSKT